MKLTPKEMPSADEVLEDNEEFHFTKLYKPRAYNRNFTVS